MGMRNFCKGNAKANGSVYSSSRQLYSASKRNIHVEIVFNYATACRYFVRVRRNGRKKFQLQFNERYLQNFIFNYTLEISPLIYSAIIFSLEKIKVTLKLFYDSRLRWLGKELHIICYNFVNFQ